MENRPRARSSSSLITIKACQPRQRGARAALSGETGAVWGSCRDGTARAAPSQHHLHGFLLPGVLRHRRGWLRSSPNPQQLEPGLNLKAEDLTSLTKVHLLISPAPHTLGYRKSISSLFGDLLRIRSEACPAEEMPQPSCSPGPAPASKNLTPKEQSGLALAANCKWEKHARCQLCCCWRQELPCTP